MKMQFGVLVALCNVACCVPSPWMKHAVDRGVKSIKQMDTMIKDGTAPVSVIPSGGDSSEDKRSWYRYDFAKDGVMMNDDRRSSPFKYGSASPEHLMSSVGYWDSTVNQMKGKARAEGFLLAQGTKRCRLRSKAWPDQPNRKKWGQAFQIDPGDGPANGFAPSMKNKRYSFNAAKGFCAPRSGKAVGCVNGAAGSVWRVEGFGGKYVCIGYGDYYLEAKPGGKVYFQRNGICTPAARFKVEGKVSDIRFKTKFGTYLGVANNEDLVHGKWGYWKKREKFWIIGNAGWTKKMYWPKKVNGSVMRMRKDGRLVGALRKGWKNIKFTSTQARFELFCQGVLDGCLPESLDMNNLNGMHRTFSANELLERRSEKIWCPPLSRCPPPALRKGHYKIYCKGRKEGECFATADGWAGCSAFHVENHGTIRAPSIPGNRLFLDWGTTVGTAFKLNFWGHGSYVCITGRQSYWRLKALKTGELEWKRCLPWPACANPGPATTDCTGAFRFKLVGAIRKEGMNSGYKQIKARGNWYTWRSYGTNVPVVGIKTKYGKYIAPYRHCNLLDTKKFPETDDGLRKWKFCQKFGRRLTAKELKLVKPKTNRPGYMKSYALKKVCDAGVRGLCTPPHKSVWKEYKFLWPGASKGKPKMPKCTAAQSQCGKKVGHSINNAREFAYDGKQRGASPMPAGGQLLRVQSKFDKNAHFRIQCGEPCMGPTHTYSRPTPPPPAPKPVPPKPAPEKISPQKKKELVKVVTQVISKTVGQKPSRRVVLKIVNKIARRKPTTGVIKRIITRVVGQKPSRRVIRGVIRRVEVRRPSRPGKNGKWFWIPNKGRGPQGPLSNEGPWSWPLVNGPGSRWPKQSPRNERDVYNQIFRDVLYKQQLRKLLYRTRFSRLRNRRDIRNVIFSKRLRDLFHNPPRAQCNRR